MARTRVQVFTGDCRMTPKGFLECISGETWITTLAERPMVGDAVFMKAQSRDVEGVWYYVKNVFLYQDYTMAIQVSKDPLREPRLERVLWQ